MSEMQSITPIEYRHIGTHVGYRFGSDGTVWSLWTLRNPKESWFLGDEWRQLKTGRDNDGYVTVKITNSETGKSQRKSLHCMILEAFRGKKPPGMEARHRNGIRDDNRIENLAWATHLENCHDKRAHGTNLEGIKKNRMGWGRVRIIRRASRRGVSTREIAKALGLTICSVNAVEREATWKPEHRRKQLA